MEQFLQVGVISSTHGVRGEVKVFPTTDDADRFRKLKHVILDTGKEQLPLEIVTRENAVELKEDEYFIADMIGMEVVTEDGKVFGRLNDVMETGANDVYIIQSQEHGEVLIPAIKECILDVDIEEKRMKIHLMDGLI